MVSLEADMTAVGAIDLTLRSHFVYALNVFFFSSRRRHTRSLCDWISDVCSSDLAALRRMSVVASDQTHRIRLAFSGGNVKFSVQTPDLGEAQDELSVTYEGEPLEIGFNAMY